MVTVRALSPRPYRLAIVPERLESCVRRLDPADRALLDLSLNRGIPDAAMAPILRTDPMRLAWKRARAIERVASRLGMTDPADLVTVRAALADLPSRAWMPLELQPAKPVPELEPPERAAPPALAPPEPAGEEPRVFRPSWTRAASPPPSAASSRASRLDSARAASASRPAQPAAASRPARAAAASRPARALALREAGFGSTYGGRPEQRAADAGRAAASSRGVLSERAKRAYPRGTMRTHARRAAGALAIGAAAALVLRLR